MMQEMVHGGVLLGFRTWEAFFSRAGWLFTSSEELPNARGLGCHNSSFLSSRSLILEILREHYFLERKAVECVLKNGAFWGGLEVNCSEDFFTWCSKRTLHACFALSLLLSCAFLTTWSIWFRRQIPCSFDAWTVSFWCSLFRLPCTRASFWDLKEIDCVAEGFNLKSWVSNFWILWRG